MFVGQLQTQLPEYLQSAVHRHAHARTHMYILSLSYTFSARQFTAVGFMESSSAALAAAANEGRLTQPGCGNLPLLLFISLSTIRSKDIFFKWLESPFVLPSKHIAYFSSVLFIYSGVQIKGETPLTTICASRCTWQHKSGRKGGGGERGLVFGV